MRVWLQRGEDAHVSLGCTMHVWQRQCQATHSSSTRHVPNSGGARQQCRPPAEPVCATQPQAPSPRAPPPPPPHYYTIVPPAPFGAPLRLLRRCSHEVLCGGSCPWACSLYCLACLCTAGGMGCCTWLWNATTRLHLRTKYNLMVSSRGTFLLFLRQLDPDVLNPKSPAP